MNTENWSDDVKRLNPELVDGGTAVLTPVKKQPSPLEVEMAAILARLTLELNLTPFEKEYRFNSLRRHRADFANIKMQMLIECEGGGWLKTSHGHGKGHLHPKRFESDCEKYNIATSLGWDVFRFTGAMIRDGRAEAFLRSVIPPF